MKICFRCNAVNVVKLSDHKPECPLLRDKKNRANDIKDLVNRYSHKNKASGPRTLGRINKPGYCKRCNEKVTSLLTHLTVCKGAPPAPPPTPPQQI
ncbi:MAG: hypothetical protein COV48_03930 [Elusimicrobia bacterium CG11_big_fil_rev_8_21_14_0_20_64_6]|nr:MAG: hypothetical protein COV48_03930 [Elusimicrobia bacterium CG11_big_fil_rev_8_21_14_0_20_64_6]